jgi:predicted molibdopterin-dependent oxidoreductase YjgC
MLVYLNKFLNNIVVAKGINQKNGVKKSKEASNTTKVRGICPYCGCGCRLWYEIDQSSRKVINVLPDKEDVISRGRPCMKGLAVHEMLNESRLRVPQIRKDKNAELEDCTWEEAFDFIKSKIDDIYMSEIGGEVGALQDLHKIRDEVYFIGSGEGTNEANYLFSKLIRNLFGSNNIDSCARLCHAATAVGFDKVFGMKAIPKYKQDDLKEADLFLFVGTDPMEDYPVLFHRVLEAKRDGAKIVTVDVGNNSTIMQSDKFVRIFPEGILPLLAHLSLRLIRGKDISRDAKQFVGFNAFVESIEEIAQDNPLSSFGVSRDDMRELYEFVDGGKKIVIGFGMGLTQHLNGVQNVLAISGLSLLLDAVLFPNRGKINVQGSGDVGAEPGWKMSDGFEEIVRRFHWSSDFLSHEGKVSTEALYKREVKLLWAMGTNPSHSMPHLNLLDENFEDMFVIYQHHHYGRTMEFADVVLPNKILPEVCGSITNGERRVRGFFDPPNRKNTIGVTAPKNAKSNLSIVSDFANRMGLSGFGHESVADVFDEMVEVVPGYGGVSRSEVAKNQGDFANKEPRKKQFVKINWEKEHFTGDGKYPYVFTTARSKFHFCTGEGTRNSESLCQRESEPYIRISKPDSKSLQLKEGDKIRIESEVGSVEGQITIDESLEKRVLIAPYHFEKLLVNKLAPLKLDPISSTPCYKQIAVNIEVVD